MYRKSTNITMNKQDLSNYIEEYDIYNSSLLLRLQDPSIVKEDYLITTNSYRPDLIAADYYGSPDYLGIMMMTTSLELKDYKKGNILSLIPKSTIDSIINSL